MKISTSAIAVALVLVCFFSQVKATADEPCYYCPNGIGMVSKNTAPIIPRTWSCANAFYIGFSALTPPAPGFDGCCNQLTICYLSCNVTKHYCDSQFFSCLLGACGIDTSFEANDPNLPHTDDTGDFGNFTGTNGAPSCRDKAVCYAGYTRGDQWCDKYQDIIPDYCMCFARAPMPATQPPNAVALPGYTGGVGICYSNGSAPTSSKLAGSSFSQFVAHVTSYMPFYSYPAASTIAFQVGKFALACACLYYVGQKVVGSFKDTR